MQAVTVGEVMTPSPDCVPSDLTVPELRAWFRRTGRHSAPVVEQSAGGTKLLGVVTLADLAVADDPEVTGDLAAPRGMELTAADICTRDPVTVTATAPVYRAVQRMAALVVARCCWAETPRANACWYATTRLRDLRGARFLEIVVAHGAPADGVEVRALGWPAGTVLTSVRRGGELLVPRGDTVLRGGDEVIALVSDTTLDDTTTLLTGRRR